MGNLADLDNAALAKVVRRALPDDDKYVTDHDVEVALRALAVLLSRLPEEATHG